MGKRRIRHECGSSQEAILFAMNDRPVVEALGFYREKGAEQHGSNQRKDD